MNRITEKRNYLAMTVVAVVAAMFIVPAGLANADHVLTDRTILSNSIVACPTDIEVRQTTFTACSFSISYTGVPAIILDAVPAEWAVTNVVDENGTPTTDCIVKSANKVPGPGKDKSGKKADRSTTKKADRSAIKIVCSETDLLDITVQLQTRESPSTKKHAEKVDKFKPTSCGVLGINDGAHAVDPVTGELIASTLGLSTVAFDQEDVDCDGLTNAEEDVNGNGIVDVGETDPNNPDTDDDGALDGADADPLDDTVQ